MDHFSDFDQPTSPSKNPTEIISHAFDSYKKVVGYGILVLLLFVVASGAISFLMELITHYDSQDLGLKISEMVKNKNFDLSPILDSEGIGSYFIGTNVLNALLYPLFAGFLYVIQKKGNGKSFDFSDLFIGFRQNTLQIILYGFISGIIMAISFYMCVLPAIFVAPLLFLGLPIVFFENKTAIEAIKKSFEIAKNNYGNVLGISFMTYFLAICGVFLCFVPVLITIPFAFCGMYSAYCAYLGTPTELPSKN